MAGKVARLATCSLNQWALDFDGNLARIMQSIREAIGGGATYRMGPELETSGYGCNDHFLEMDTFMHSWELLCTVVDAFRDDRILIDVGAPVVHRNMRYNCRVLIFMGEILLIRPKMQLANDGNYRETRWFSAWQRPGAIEDFVFPIAWGTPSSRGQSSCPFGDAVIQAHDGCIGFEICEELFTPESTSTSLALDGVEIISNGSGSHHELRKLHRRMELIMGATSKLGGIYMYANQKGCDGERVYYDGSSVIVQNGSVLSQGAQFSIKNVEVVFADVSLEEVRQYRGGNRSMSVQGSAPNRIRFPRVKVDLVIAQRSIEDTPLTKKRAPFYHTPEMEITLGPACWLWDYLRRSGAAGFFLPLSGGLDSCSTAVLVHSMSSLVVDAILSGDADALSDARRVTADATFSPSSAADLTRRLFHTCYLGTANSSAETRDRARTLAAALGSYHVDLDMDGVVSAVTSLFAAVTGKSPQFRAHGGSASENLALQNVQARLRMVLSYMFAQLLPWVRSDRGRSLLVLGSANVDEGLRGYLTKYDCSSADINPIGGISKTDLKLFLGHAEKHFGLPCIATFVNAVPTAELEPITESYRQTDEADMGMTYDELSAFGRARKIDGNGPVSMFWNLVDKWRETASPAVVAEKVKRFFYYYAINRHKMTTITPSYHAESYSPDDNRFDMRPFLYNATWSYQFGRIDEAVERLAKRARAAEEDETAQLDANKRRK